MKHKNKQMAVYPLRMPDELKKHLKHKAVNNGRSLNSEIVQRLLASQRKDEAHKKAPENTTSEASN